MKKLNKEQMEAVSAGYCDSVLELVTGSCTNAGCIVASAFNMAMNTAGLDYSMACYK